MAIEIEDSSPGDEAYHDDPIDPQPRTFRFRRSQSILASILVLVFGTYFLQTTLAGNININSGGRIEFGQGVSRFTACSGATPLTFTPRASFINQTGAGLFYFSSFTISNIPAQCSGSSFTLSAFGASSSTPLSLFDTSTTNSIINDSSGTYSSGSGSSLTVTTNSSSSFTATFTNPVALSSAVVKLTLQSAANITPTYNSIQLASATNLRFSPGITVGTNAFTIETWLKTDSNLNPGDIIGNSGSAGLSFILDSATEVHIDGYFVNAYHYVLPVTLQPNTWYHIAIARDASLNESVWVNGVRSTSAYVTNGSPNGTGVITDPINYSGLAIAINYADCGHCVPGSSKFDGERISNLRIVVGSTLYDPNSATITVPTMPLTNVAGTQLLLLFNDAGSITVDSSGNQTVTNNGTTFVTGQ